MTWREPRVWGVGEDPLMWSFPVGRVGSLAIRVHVLLVMWMGAELVAWVPRSAIGLVHIVAAVVVTCGILLVREITREAFRRGLGGEPLPVVLWPLGGLGGTPAGPVSRPFLAESGGLLAGALLVPILGGLVVASGAGWSALSLDLLSPRVTAGGLRSHIQIWAWWAYYMNAVVLVTNALVPMLPFDAGRILRTFMARRGEASAARALRLGLYTALAVFIVGACMGELRILTLGALGALATYLEIRRAEFLAAAVEEHPVMAASDSPEHDPREEDTVSPVDHASSCLDLDTILRQISRDGMNSLSPEQRDVLRRETQRRQRR
ncbi:MAG: hypothetical protein HBSAPP03_11780 [Phycisphaerae bacterium]|nr:MAG: hypothetical protein HBSAPP03_11780 [Phycisphaerae bacterium]